MMDSINNLVERVLAGERRAIAHAISLVEEGNCATLCIGLARHLGHARVVGITGSPGAGKSTLINALVHELLTRNQRVAIMAVDPSSPLTGGAILGDRIRITKHQDDERVFIRSLASRGHLGGLTAMTTNVVDVLDAAGFDVVIVEAVGSGQSEVEIAKIAKPCIVVCPPNAGDEVQALKAGILEIADVLVVNKADLAGAMRTEQALNSMLALKDQEHRPSLLRTVATTGDGVSALADIVLDQAPRQRGCIADSEAADRVAHLLLTDPYSSLFGADLLDAGEGRAIVRVCVRPEHLNFWGGCHGGAVFSIADMALGLACNSYGIVASLIDSHMTFTSRANAGDLLIASAMEVNRSRRIGIYRSNVARGNGELIASLTGTVYITNKQL